MTVFVLMATCNGARWLPEQIQSVRAQSEADWHLLVSDDGSTDGSRELVQRFCEQDSRITLLQKRDGQPGAVGNFEYLLQQARTRLRGDSDCLALCDQDDIWLPDKLGQQCEQLAERLGVCSDALLVDENNNTHGVSLLRQLSATDQPTLESQLAQNSVIGCTLMLHPRVLELALPFPAETMNHDWWLGLCVLALGDLHLDLQPRVRYRQHASNSVGAYRPWQQLWSLPALIMRQRLVLRSQREAAATLLNRLERKDMESPAVLSDYLRQMSEYGSRLRALSSGRFAAPHLPLRALRLAAAISL
jgi:rhamnosyltransferase